MGVYFLFTNAPGPSPAFLRLVIRGFVAACEVAQAGMARRDASLYAEAARCPASCPAA
jgi:hypothetical protein